MRERPSMNPQHLTAREHLSVDDLTVQQIRAQFGFSERLAKTIERRNRKTRMQLLSAPMIAKEYVIDEPQAAAMLNRFALRNQTEQIMAPQGECGELIHRWRLRYLIPRDIAPDVRGYVYFIQHETGGLIKIGISENPERRLKGFNANSHDPRYRILATASGGRMLEEALHQKFAGARAHGEWFKPHKRLLKYISDPPDA